MQILARAAALTLIALLPLSSAKAQNYPAATVKLIVPFGAGGPADVFSRQLAQASAGRTQANLRRRGPAGSRLDHRHQ